MDQRYTLAPRNEVEEDQFLLGTTETSVHAFDLIDPRSVKASLSLRRRCIKALSSFCSSNKRQFLFGFSLLLVGVLMGGLVVMLTDMLGPGDERGYPSCHAAKGPGFCYTERETVRAVCGDEHIEMDDCQQQGCCWSRSSDASPSCFQPNAEYPVYTVLSKTQTEIGWELVLMNLPSGPKLESLGMDFMYLRVVAAHESEGRLHVKITRQTEADAAWEVPEYIFPRPQHPSSMPSNTSLLFLTPEVGEVFSFSIVRPPLPGSDAAACLLHNASSVKVVAGLTDASREVAAYEQALLGSCKSAAGGGEVLFDSSGLPFVYKPQYIELSSHLPASALLLGLGENTQTGGLVLPRNGQVITMWNADLPSGVNVNLYGSHPFHLDVRPQSEGSAHGTFLLNSNGIDVMLLPESLTYRMIGGVVDLYFFAGPDPEQVTRQYHEVVGKPAMPPRWSLGFHQSRWGYSDLDAIKTVVKEYAAADLPLEVMWSDIDYMDKNKVFSFDPKNYPEEEFKAFVDGLHAANQRWVPILDCGVAAVPGFEPYETGLEKDIFIKDREGKPFLGQVWPGPTHWPDFLNPASVPYWQQHLKAMHSSVPFDGIWLDMNEPSNFCDSGDVCRLASNYRLSKLWSECEITCDAADAANPLVSPPYNINNWGDEKPLGHKTLPPTAVHYGNVSHYNAHNLYPLAEVKATNQALSALRGERPFMLSRASFPGLGHYASHWTGDNSASWDQLRYSITSVVNSNLFGIPHVGADICGFGGATTEELCARWLSAGAFYPFSRDHSDNNSPPQEAYLWEATKQAAKQAFGLRYQLLPYIYSSFLMAHLQGGTVARPPLFLAPTDPLAVTASSSQWLLGDALLVAPVLQEGVVSVDVYLPPGRWYDAWTSDWMDGPHTTAHAAPMGHIPVFLRSGAVVPMQTRDVGGHVTTEDMAATGLTLVVTLPALGGEEESRTAWQQSQCMAHMASSLAGAAGKNGTQGIVTMAGQFRGPDGVVAAVDALGMLYADDGTTLDVGGDSCLEVWFGAKVVATNSGWLAAAVHSAPKPRPQPGATAAQDPSLLRYAAVEVIGLHVPPSKHSYSVTVQNVSIASTDSRLHYDSARMKLVVDVGSLDILLISDLHLQWHL